MVRKLEELVHVLDHEQDHVTLIQKLLVYHLGLTTSEVHVVRWHVVSNSMEVECASVCQSLLQLKFPMRFHLLAVLLVQ